jgi:hypothetical protein
LQVNMLPYDTQAFTVKIHLLATDPHRQIQTFCPADMAGQKQYAPKGHRQFICWCVHQRIRSFVCVSLCGSSERSERVVNYFHAWW